MEHNATDRLMRDSIRGCYGTERLLLLHHTLHYRRPKFSGNTIVRMSRSWSLVPAKRKVTSLEEFIFRKKVLHLEIEFSRRDKEEV